MSLVVQDNLSISLCFVYLQAPMVLTEAKSIDARVGEDSLAILFLIKAVVRHRPDILLQRPIVAMLPMHSVTTIACPVRHICQVAAFQNIWMTLE